MMITVAILKNGQLIKQFYCPEKMVQKYFEMCVDLAGGMWDGKNEYTVVIL